MPRDVEKTDPPLAVQSAARFRVSGRVQGVGFRWWARDTARSLGLAGWVRNCNDGSVAVGAAGTKQGLSAFAQALARGPRGARVDSVVRSEPAPGETIAADEKEFEIRR